MDSKKFDEDSTIIIFIILFQLPKVTGINERCILKMIVDNFKDDYNRISHKYIIFDILQKNINTIERIDPSFAPSLREKICMDRGIDTSIYEARCLGCSRGSLWQDNIFKDLTFITEKNFFVQFNEENELIPASIRVRAKYLKLHKRRNLMLDYRKFTNEGKRILVMELSGENRRRVGLSESWKNISLNHDNIIFPKSLNSIIITEDGQDNRTGLHR